jgi:hypothetical protein
MATKKKKTTIIPVRDFSLELIEKLKDYTGEKTAAKVVKICCEEYLELNATKKRQAERIRTLEDSLQEIKSSLLDKATAEKEILRFLKG